MNADLLNFIKRVKALSETGLLYTQNEYDIDRYEELKALSFNMLKKLTNEPVTNIKLVFNEVTDYPTPKIDVRGLVLNHQNELLLVKEKMDGKWTIPGGWCEIGLSPKENLIKEMEEETGLNVQIERLLALFDKKHHNHPPHPLYVYKLVFYCRANESQPMNPNYEIEDIGYFNIEKLPELSTDRIIKNQLKIVYEKAINNTFDVYFD